MNQTSLLVVAARVVAERPVGPGARKGTRHFRPGAKVFVIDGHRGTCETVTVVGHHRAGGRYARLDMPVRHLDDFRLARTYSPKVIALIEAHYAGADPYTAETAEELCRLLPHWKAGA